jgi:hypothetical protein
VDDRLEAFVRLLVVPAVADVAQEPRVDAGIELHSGHGELSGKALAIGTHRGQLHS